ncbi:unnamed protein product, partial [Phaeothamnion confervicola]
QIGLLATVGVGTVMLVGRPVVGVMSTGDELVEPDAAAPLSGSMIRDSNRCSLLAAVGAMGATAMDLGIVRDKSESLRDQLQDAAARCDVIITSGGVSMGEADLLKPTLEELGTIHFGRVCMKPGKPTTFATIPRPDGGGGGGRSTLVFALPGNPVSCLVTTHLFVWPALRRLSGRALADCVHPQASLLVDVRVTSPLKLDPERAEYHRAIVRWDAAAGAFVAASTGSQMSSRLLSMKSANALLCLPAASGLVAAGDAVPALLIGELLAPPPISCYHRAALLGSLGAADAAAAATVAGMESGGCGSGHNRDHGHGHSHGHGHACNHDRNHAYSHDGHGHGHSNEHSHSHTAASSGGMLRPIQMCLLTVSDRAAAGVYNDLSGPAMKAAMTAEAVAWWADQRMADVILTSGGTGFGPRDRTPEAIRPLFDREAPSIVHAIMQGGLKHTPLAVLSRPVAGVRGSTLIVTLPGSVKAVKENVATLAPLLPRIVNLLRGNECS